MSRRIVATLTLVVLGVGLAIAPAPAAPSVADAEQAARDAADRHLEAQRRLASTTAEREALEESIARTEEHLEELQVLAAARSVDAYKRAGATLAISFDVADAGEVDRGNALLARVAADERRVFRELTRTREELDDQRSQLEERLAREESEAADLEDTADAMNAQLANARNRAAAEAEAAAAAAAAAAAEAAAADAAARDAEATAATSPPPTTAAVRTAAPSAPPPPPDYSGTPGTHPRHGHPWMVCTRQIESASNYQAHNPAGPYWGAYQFLQSTWNAAANNFGRPDLIGVRPDRASPYDQDDIAWRLFDGGNGAGHWGNRCMDGW